MPADYLEAMLAHVEIAPPVSTGSNYLLVDTTPTPRTPDIVPPTPPGSPMPGQIPVDEEGGYDPTKIPHDPGEEQQEPDQSPKH